MTKPPKKAEADFTPAEADRRRDEIARRLLSTPHKPHKPLGKKRAKRARK